VAFSMTVDERRCNPTSPLSHVAIVGGTHGNERMGLALLKEWQATPPKSTFQLSLVLANEKAAEATGTGAGRRYVDVDLNRCFALTDLTREGVPEAGEERRAREIDALLGPKSSPNPKCDLILDLHSTTANTGVLLCVHPKDTFALQLAAHLTSLDPEVRIALWPNVDDVPLLPTVARSGMTVEVGPCAHSTVVSTLLHKTRKLILDALAYVELHNKCCADPGAALKTNIPLSTYARVHTLDYPQRNGDIAAYIHPALQGVRELDVPLKESDAVFEGTDGSSITLREALAMNAPSPHVTEQPLYPMFVNEAAYYEKGIAFMVAHRRVEDVTVWKDPPQ